jgi:sugar fermentation stimulation protein A
MKFRPALIQGTLIKRYKRFLADVILDNSGEKITAYVPNTGSMRSCLKENAKVALSYHPDSGRKLPYTLEMISTGEYWIGINTSLTNDLVAEALEQQKIQSLENCKIYREVSIFDSRIDFLLENNQGEKIYLEVKNVSYKNESMENLAQFPDAVTTRGLKHLEDLIKIKQAKHRAIIFYLVQRQDCQKFSIASHIDPNYHEGFKAAVKAGVEVLVYQTEISPDAISISRELPWTL